MGAAPNTVFLRLEGPFQAWGANSKFVIRRTMEAPTKSGITGLLCCALGLSREAAEPRLADLAGLEFGVRADRPGTVWWDYHTVGAGIGVLTAEGRVKRTATTKQIETLITRREYLCDASFLVALRGSPDLIEEIADALRAPRWPVYLGRKCCPPAVPVLQQPREGEAWANPMHCESLADALHLVPWCPRYPGEKPDQWPLVGLLEWRPTEAQTVAPDDAEVWYDTPLHLDPPYHQARLVLRQHITPAQGLACQRRPLAPPRRRANYASSAYRAARLQRLESDHGLCVFCKSPATTVQHITYRRAGGEETQTDLRSLCRLCHDAVTMIEYGLGMGLDRINPEEPRWRDRIAAKRREIIEFRSLETRRRRLTPEEVE